MNIDMNKPAFCTSSEPRRVAFMLAEVHGVDYVETLDTIRHMTRAQVRAFIADLREKARKRREVDKLLGD